MTTMVDIEFSEFHEEMVGAIVDRCVKWRRDARELESKLAAALAEKCAEPGQSPLPSYLQLLEDEVCLCETETFTHSSTCPIFKLRTAAEDSPTPPPADGVGYYCDKCGQKMRVEPPVKCFCDNKDCEVISRKNPPLSAAPPAEGSAYATAMREDFGKDVSTTGNVCASCGGAFKPGISFHIPLAGVQESDCPRVCSEACYAEEVSHKIVFDKSAVEWMNQKDSPPAEGVGKIKWSCVTDNPEKIKLIDDRGHTRFLGNQESVITHLAFVMQDRDTLAARVKDAEALHEHSESTVADLRTRVAELEELNQVERQSNTNAAGRELALQGELDELRLQFNKKINVIRSKRGTIEIRDATIADLQKRLATADKQRSQFLIAKSRDELEIVNLKERLAKGSDGAIDSLVNYLRSRGENTSKEGMPVGRAIFVMRELDKELAAKKAESKQVRDLEIACANLVTALQTAERERDEAINKRHRAEVALYDALYDENGAVAKATTAQADTARLAKEIESIIDQLLEECKDLEDVDFRPVRKLIDKAATAAMGDGVCTCENPDLNKADEHSMHCALYNAAPTPDAGEKVDPRRTIPLTEARAMGVDHSDKPDPTVAERIEAVGSEMYISAIDPPRYSFAGDIVTWSTVIAALESIEALKAKKGGDDA